MVAQERIDFAEVRAEPANVIGLAAPGGRERTYIAVDALLSPEATQAAADEFVLEGDAEPTFRNDDNRKAWARARVKRAIDTAMGE